MKRAIQPLILMGLLVGSFANGQDVNEPPNIPFRISQMVHDVPMDDNPEAWNRWKIRIRNEPDITPYLLEMLAWNHKHQDNIETVGLASLALKQRSDLTPQQLRQLAETFSTSHKRRGLERSQFDQNVLGGIGILANYPSAEHEKLLIDFLDDPDDVVKLQAVTGLDKLGSIAALPKLKEQLASFRTGSIVANELKLALESSVATLSKSPRMQVPSASTKASANSKQPTDEGASSFPSSEQAESPSWGIFVVMIAAAIGLLWLLVKNRK